MIRTQLIKKLAASKRLIAELIGEWELNQDEVRMIIRLRAHRHMEVT
jgi:hypothetical protein